MATRWAISSGNWSSTASWNGFTLPDVVDDVFADGKTITIDQNIQVGTLNTWLRTGGTTGGQFRVTASGIYITASQIKAGSSNCLLVTSGAQNVNVFSDITHQNASNFVYSVYIDALSTVNIVGTASTGTKSSGTSDFSSIWMTNATLNMNGNVIAAGTASNGWGIVVDTDGKLNLIGNITSGSVSTNYGAYIRNNAVVSVTGSVFGVSSNGMYLTNMTGTVTINGNVISYNSTAINSVSSPGTVNINGTIRGGDVASARGYLANNGYLNSNGFILGGIGANSYGVEITSVVMSHTGSVIAGINSASRGIQMNNSNVTINGNVIAGTGIGVNYLDNADGIYSSGNSTLTITGTVSAKRAQGILLNSTGPTIINGGVNGTITAWGVYHINIGTLTVDGNQNAQNINYRTANAGNLTINGNLTAPTGTHSRMIYDLSSSGKITINGNINQQNVTPIDATGLIRFDGTSTLDINGNVTAGSTSNTTSIYSGAANRINITGNVTAGNLSAAVSLVVAGATLSITGDLIASSNYPAVLSPTTTSRTIVSGNIVNTNDYMAYYGYLLQVSTSSVINYTIQSENGSNRVLSSTSSSNNVPLTRDVRLNTQFGSSNELTGTLAVPTASSVSYGVPVDNTIGTAILNVNDVGALLAGFII